MTPFFSIIIPVYNVAPYLRECLDSVLAQTFTDWEAICVDDGSADDSGKILNVYALKDKRFKIIHQRNAGVSVARNVALGVAKGEWVSFLDADDVWDDNWLCNVYRQVEEGIDWIRTGWTEWRGHTKTRRLPGLCSSCRLFKGDAALEIGWRMVSMCAFPFLNFYRRSIISTITFVPGIRFREDALFLYEAAAFVRGLKIVDETGYLHRERAGSATNSGRGKKDSVNLLAAYFELWVKTFRRQNKKPTSSIIDASTFWVIKDIVQWVRFCSDRTVKDTLDVWMLAWRLVFAGACRIWIGGTWFVRIRWLMFMLTSCGWLLSLSHHTPHCGELNSED